MSTIEKALQKQREQAEKQARDKAQAAEEQPQSSVEAQAETCLQSNDVETTQADAVTSVSNSTSTPKTNFIDLEHTKSEGFVSGQDRNAINEEFRAVKRKVLNNAFGPLAKTLDNSNIIMVTSPNPGEGKTFTAINLALSIALEQDKTVLLVDADVLRPNVMRTIKQPFGNGLMEYLLGEVDDLSEVIYHTSLDKLKIIPAGKGHHLSTELLASTKMLDTVNEFSTRYSDRVVIFDTPPLLGINETAVLANLAGQALIVVQEGKTSLTKLSKAVEQLNPEMAKGFIMNKVTKNSSDDISYGYYYSQQ
ncbi:XrtA-associated tyrosine autokinase [Fluctibacter corallii]|uniref:XrtA-associated tyrosine autokinase n=1 Tax=Fluctibacter corallii TaxID=2984329 RepID=UPI00384F305B